MQAPRNGTPASSTPACRLIASVDEAYQRMLDAIAGATHSVRLEMYIFTAEPIGERFRDALTAAASRGVEVKVLLDSFGSARLTNRFWQPLREAGGSARWFNPIRMQSFAFRNHRKALICDGATAFVGGFNIAAEYEGDGIQRGWRDFGIELHGELAAGLVSSFDWLFERADVPHRWLARLGRAKTRRSFTSAHGQLLLSGPGWGKSHLGAAIRADLGRAQEVRIVSAYFLPPRRIRRALREAAHAGRRVTLILPGKSDVLISQLATRWLYRSLLRAGVEIYEYSPQILHAKLFVFDDVVYAGSANLNVRSLSIDYELLVRLPDASLAAEARRQFDDMLELSAPIDRHQWRDRYSAWLALVERAAYFLVARLDPLIAGRQLKYLR
jgi:cardiolipin synthase A/B